MTEARQPQEKASTTEEELARLREAVRQKEAELEQIRAPHTTEEVIQKTVEEYKAVPAEKVLHENFALAPAEVGEIVLNLAPEKDDEKMAELIGIANERGIKNALAVLDGLKSPHLEDDFHRFLVSFIKAGYHVSGLEKEERTNRLLHMTLYEVSLPETVEDEQNQKQKPLKEIISAMEQFYAGMAALRGNKGGPTHFALELAVADESDDIVFYVAVPDSARDLFEKQVVSLFPKAQVKEQPDDYNIFVDGGVSIAATARFEKRPIFSLKTYEQFDTDPFSVLITAFSKIEREGGGAAIQIIISPEANQYAKKYNKALEKIQKGKSLREAIDIPETVLGDVWKVVRDGIKEMLKDIGKKKKDEPRPEESKMATSSPVVDQSVIENIRGKIATPIMRANIRIAVSAKTAPRAEQILTEIASAFNQFETPQGNAFLWNRLSGETARRTLTAFTYRDFLSATALPLSIRELTTLVHFPRETKDVSPQFKQVHAATAPAPLDLPREGLLLGTNTYRSIKTEARLTKEDRVRHLYTIGQTGTGKTNFLKQMIAQDIENGEGVCFIDPHGSDVEDVLSMVPEHRAKDVIYFNPANLERVFGLNMLEYDPRFPEQKTFVVNELFSIFRQLYKDIPESMGPAFEQYFRNATNLVLEDPASGNTLLDISRIFADATYRELKLLRSKNPVVNQFWRDIASKASGEQGLQNYAPYVTNKFDIFTANDYMRPIIAQEKSSFNFRDIMDSRKILLVNLSKGKLGDINANLIGLIIVGKFLMAALSRVDSLGENLAPFYLYLDEFQNITTPSIATILSEARKYKLSLTVAHQFIAQLDDKIKDAVFGNVGSIAAFRVGPEDAEFLEKQFAPTFKAHDIMNIDNYNCYLKMLAAGKPVKPFNIAVPSAPKGDPTLAASLRELSLLTYGKPRAEVEAMIQERYGM